jgi:2-polyprenyl-6-methoxyphenol hydroxylase-like FAD-dependent oxidoreductase
MCTMKDLGSFFEDSFETIEKEYGHKMYYFHRADLHAGLHELAKTLGVRIYLGLAVDEINPGEGSISFKDGKVIQKDLVIVADGHKV